MISVSDTILQVNLNQGPCNHQLSLNRSTVASMESSVVKNGLSMSPQTAHLFAQFKEISSRVRTKSRGIIGSKRVDLHEISDQFVRLAREFAPFSKAYQANCYLAAARAERLIQSPSAVTLEYEYLLEAARLFRDAAYEFAFDPDHDGDCEELDNAIALYRDAIKLSREEMLPAIWQELARVYISVKKFVDAALCYQEAGCVIKSAVSFIQAGDFASALTCYEKASDSLLNDEDRITLFLLKLVCQNVHMLRVSSHRLSPEASVASSLPLLRRINSINTNDSIRFPILPVSESPLLTSGTFSKCPRQGVTEETTSINVLLESLYLFIRDVKDANDCQATHTAFQVNQEELRDDHLNSSEADATVCHEREVRNGLARQLYEKLGHNAIHKLLLGQLLMKDLM